MKFSRVLFSIGIACFAASLKAVSSSPTVAFDWFEYQGRDPIFESALPAGSYRNPILAGFYPDPSICRANDDFYLVNSTFVYTPGIPIFKSKDLVHWRQIANVIARPNELKFDGLEVSRGVFAPDIQFHRGKFYLVNTAVESGGNFYLTATDPAGPWSDPHWLPEVDGIDPSFFFDEDGKTYLINNGPPKGPPLYEGHRAIWIQEFDLAKEKLVGPRQVLVNGGTDPDKKPRWIEGPHLYRRNGWYYLMCAEGGTEAGHSEVVFRSRSVLGPFASFPKNPILTQRDLPAERSAPITCTGHASLVEAPDGSWWAGFLGCRPYQGDYFNTGRETFLLPVTWHDDWPVILPAGETVPLIVKGPGIASPATPLPPSFPLNGNFTLRDNFDQTQLALYWLRLRDDHSAWADLTSRPGFLTIHPLRASLSSTEQPSFLARRQQHQNFSASSALTTPDTPGMSAGLAVFQNATHHFFFGLRREGKNYIIFLERANGAAPELIAQRKVPLQGGETIKLKIDGDGAAYSFSYGTTDSAWTPLLQNADGTILSTTTAGGFVGATIGPYARIDTEAVDLPSRF